MESKDPHTQQEQLEHQGNASEKQAELILSVMTGALTTNLLTVGDRLGLFAGLSKYGPCSAEDLAKQLSLNPRYISEWCRQMASTHIISTDEDAKMYWLNEAQKDTLVREFGDEASPYFSLGMLQAIPDFYNMCTGVLPELFKTGKGLTYDAYGEDLACGACRELGVWMRHFLPERCRALPGGVGEKLERGCLVADVGCGCGEAIFVAAAAFPASTFHGFDISETALAQARRTAAERSLKNVEFINPGVEERGMGEVQYDFVMTHDALHDMARPYEVMKSVRKSMKEGAVWVIGDMKAAPSHGVNVHKNPLAPLLYGFSCHLCLPSALSAPNAEGLGTLGLSENLMKEKLMEAGFKKVSVLDWDHPLNRYYLASTTGAAAEE